MSQDERTRLLFLAAGEMARVVSRLAYLRPAIMTKEFDRNSPVLREMFDAAEAVTKRAGLEPWWGFTAEAWPAAPSVIPEPRSKDRAALDMATRWIDVCARGLLSEDDFQAEAREVLGRIRTLVPDAGEP